MKELLDITDIAAKSRVVEIPRPDNGLPSGILVTLLPPDDPKMRFEKRRIDDSILALRQRNKQLTHDILEANAIALIRAAIADWDWSKSELGFHGSRPEFSRENVTAVLKEVRWFRDFLDSELGDETAFFQA